MKSLSRSLLLSTILSPALAFAAGEALSNEDIEALRQFIFTKRQETLKELSGKLSISGETRFEFQATGETKNGVRQRGSKGATDVPERGFDIEVNVMIDYRTERTWASIKIEFDENAGIFEGDAGRVALERGYFGGRFLLGNTYTGDIEMGRRQMGRIFDSRIEFASRYDGVLLKYDQALRDYGDVYLHGGGFVINEKQNHYGFAFEVGFLNIANTGAYIKYSLIDWDTKSFDSEEEENRFRYINSQFILAYRFVPQPFDRVVLLYSAVLINHAANRLPITNDQKANIGGYLGFSIGQLRKKGDWAIDANFQVVEAQAVPAFDQTGIGLGNAARCGLYTCKSDGTGGPTNIETAAGSGNYRGFVIQWDYLITDNLNVSQNWQQSQTLNKDIGPFRRYKQYEIEFIYAF